MSETIFNTRIINKHDIEMNWLATGSAFVPKYGEIIVYDTDTTHNRPRIKIGNNSTEVNSLPFIIGEMADINNCDITNLSSVGNTLNNLLAALKNSGLMNSENN